MPCGRDHGFSLLELLLSLAIVLVISGATLSMMAASAGTARTQPVAVDLQQRARVGADQLFHDLYMAGAGMYYGATAGPLRRFFAPVVPRRMGLQNPDPPNVARADAITLMFVPTTRAQSALRMPLPTSASDLRVNFLPHCPAGDLLCALGVGTSLVVFDTEGHFDFFTVTQTIGDAGHLRQWQASHAIHGYVPGAAVAEAEWHTYYFDAPNRQLRHFDGYLTDIPVVDEVVGLTFAYFGDPAPPDAPRPPLGTVNCLYDASGGLLPAQTLPRLAGSLAALPLTVFSDGPWCGDGENVFDADLLRVRQVRVTLRLQAGNTMFRGQTTDFAVAGKSLNAAQRVADYVVRFDVAPRNMGWDRAW